MKFMKIMKCLVDTFIFYQLILALKKLILIANYIDFLETNLPYNGKLLNIDRTALRELIRKFQ